MIRPAWASDASAIGTIWNHAIRTSTATFTTIEKTEADIQEMITARPVLVLTTDEGLIGFATYGTFRSGPGYAHVAEHSVYVTETARRCGHGSALLHALLDVARAKGLRIMVAGISGDNHPAQALHTRLGFEKTGRLPGVGQKFGRALDLVLMQKNLAAPD
jgi:phosphinothricin acetyltransferase